MKHGPATGFSGGMKMPPTAVTARGSSRKPEGSRTRKDKYTGVLRASQAEKDFPMNCKKEPETFEMPRMTGKVAPKLQTDYIEWVPAMIMATYANIVREIIDKLEAQKKVAVGGGKRKLARRISVTWKWFRTLTSARAILYNGAQEFSGEWTKCGSSRPPIQTNPYPTLVKAILALVDAKDTKSLARLRAMIEEYTLATDETAPGDMGIH